ncbi:hypothetical protein BE17_20835 [Sorangium cellulosum]|uniref:Uncharacterized protein n=1 Tax=Sorangium cellulosum TaxID=56 RepID=A0A150RSU6_SORCE|nr:hypothetical protein BE17_20835 [Sorangium cellulosum]
MPGILRVEMGQLLFGRYSAADRAFERAVREVDRLTNHVTWETFLGRTRALEEEFAATGGLNPDVQEALDSPYGYFGLSEALTQHLKALELLSDLEDFATALILTLQTRLAAVDARALRVYEAASGDDKITTLPKYEKNQLLRAHSSFAGIWSLANYIKHNDEWGPVLEKQQRKTFDALVGLGLAKEVAGVRELEPWLIVTAVSRITGKTKLSEGLSEMISICERVCLQALALVQADFAPFYAQIDASREESATRAKLEEARLRAEADDGGT